MKIWWVAALLLLSACVVPREERRVEESAQRTQNLYNAKVHTELAAAYYSRGRFDVALEELDIALRSAADYVPAHNMRGLTYMQLREDKQAQQNFTRALELAPNDPETNNNYGWFLCTRGRPQEAIRYFMQALRDPLYAAPDKPLSNAGICSRRAGDQVAAENYFRRALAIRADQPQANFHLADMAYRRGDFERTRTLLNKAMESGDLTAEMLWLKVRLERKLGDRSAETSYALQLRKRFPQAPETQRMLQGAFD